MFPNNCRNDMYIKFLSCILKKGCAEGYYGDECSKVCGWCKHADDCYHVNGTCLNGCESGYIDDMCKTRKYIKTVFSCLIDTKELIWIIKLPADRTICWTIEINSNKNNVK